MTVKRLTDGARWPRNFAWAFSAERLGLEAARTGIETSQRLPEEIATAQASPAPTTCAAPSAAVGQPPRALRRSARL